MTPDFRSDRLSPEGSGNARRVWEACPEAAKFGKRGKGIPLVTNIARSWVEELVGFWVVWHFYGGFAGLERFGYHRATIYRKVSRFRQVFGVHPDEYDFPGLTVDLAAYYEDARMKREAKRPSPRGGSPAR